MRDYIVKTVKAFIKKHETNSLPKLVKDLGIILIYQPLGDVWGMYKYMKKSKVIFINSTLDEVVQIFVLAHELGHAVLHPKSSCFCYGLHVNSYKKELEANIFAAELLLKEFDIELVKVFNVEQLASYYHVPVDLIRIKLGM